MTIKLANGKLYDVIVVSAEPEYKMGAQRDVMSIVMDGNTSLEEVLADFTETNCESITIKDGDVEAVHTGYTIVLNISREKKEVKPATTDTEAVYDWRVVVKLGQRTYYETQLAMIRRVQEEQAEVIAEMAFGGEM